MPALVDHRMGRCISPLAYGLCELQRPPPCQPTGVPQTNYFPPTFALLVVAPRPDSLLPFPEAPFPCPFPLAAISGSSSLGQFAHVAYALEGLLSTGCSVGRAVCNEAAYDAFRNGIEQASDSVTVVRAGLSP